jgi:tetratricopeptide (TPR) repeat protein
MRLLLSRSLLVLSLALVPVLRAPSAAAATEPTPSELSVARRLFDEGRAAEDAGHWREAADKFRKATAIKDTPGMRFHLAKCEEQQGAFVEALVEFDRARELIDSGMKAADVEKLLADARERVRRERQRRARWQGAFRLGAGRPNAHQPRYAPGERGGGGSHPLRTRVGAGHG